MTQSFCRNVPTSSHYILRHKYFHVNVCDVMPSCRGSGISREMILAPFMPKWSCKMDKKVSAINNA